MIRKLRRKFREEQYILIKADKSNAIVTMQESTYDTESFQVLEKFGATISDILST